MTTRSLVRRLPREMEGLNSFVERFFNDPFLGRTWPRSETVATWSPAVDVREDAEAYIFTADLPGMKRDDLELSIEDNVLTLSGERSFKDEEDTGQYRRIEREYGRFTRSFSLPSQVSSDRVEASFNDGVLTVRVPKSEAAKAHKIKIH